MKTGIGRETMTTYGSCDVSGCRREIYMGWRPLTERLGRKVCEYHWRRHEDETDNFDLFEAFGFRRPARTRKPAVKKQTDGCACGRELPPGRRLCTVCAEQRERRRKRQYYHQKKNHQTEPAAEEDAPRCRQCGGERPRGHTYCQKCSQGRRRQGNRERQRRHYRKSVKCVGLT
jgi:hypothetical protein